ncbi:hypothetical protein E4T50_07045, partial [Aureobasidium sp. EXF-12298]
LQASPLLRPSQSSSSTSSSQPATSPTLIEAILLMGANGIVVHKCYASILRSYVALVSSSSCMQVQEARFKRCIETDR